MRCSPRRGPARSGPDCACRPRRARLEGSNAWAEYAKRLFRASHVRANRPKARVPPRAGAPREGTQGADLRIAQSSVRGRAARAHKTSPAFMGIRAVRPRGQATPPPPHFLSYPLVSRSRGPSRGTSARPHTHNGQHTPSAYPHIPTPNAPCRLAHSITPIAS